MKYILALLLALLGGCFLTTLFQNAPPQTQTLSQDCTPEPVVTDVQLFPAQFMAAPPEQIQAGSLVRIEFTGGVEVMPIREQCGDHSTLLEPNQETAEATTRQVQVKLDDEVVLTQQCGYHCVLEFSIPLYMGGNHEWRLVGVTGTDKFPVYIEPIPLT